MKKLFALILVLSFALAGCNRGNPAPATTATESSTGEVLATSAPTETKQPTLEATATLTASPTALPSPTATPLPVSYGPSNFPANVNPLTGLGVSDTALLERRPLAVKIQMFPRGQRPAWGISLADIVYDFYQNNGLTRLHAIFYGNDASKVGPVRSARFLDASLVNMYKSNFAFAGADQRILNRLFNSGYYERLVLEGSSNPSLYRVDPNGTDLLFTNTQEMSKYISGKGVENGRQNLDGMSFQYEPPSGGVAGTQVAVRYSISAFVRWDYDPATGRYLRNIDALDDNGQGESYAPMMDGLTNTQVAADNVVVLEITHEMVRTGANEIVDILLSPGASGDATLFRDGQAYTVKWSRPSLDSVITLLKPDGTPIPFKQGSTWFQVIGLASKMSVDGGAWRFVLGVP